MKWKSDEAMKRGDNAGSLTLLTIGLKNGWSRDATPADIIAALKANPEARAEVLDALGEPPASRRLDVAAAIARAEQAERERDQWRAKWEALETTRAACCDQMERERDEARDTAALDEIRAQQRLESLAHDHAKAVAERDEARALAEERRDYARAQNAKLSVENDALRARLAKTEAVVEAARTDLRTADILIDGARAGAGGTTAERLEQATRGIRAALAKGGE